jgi:hypothetical protein
MNKKSLQTFGDKPDCRDFFAYIHKSRIALLVNYELKIK